MPSRVTNDLKMKTITIDEVLDRIKDAVNQTLIIDCRTEEVYKELHIKGAVNFTLPSSMLVLRRLANGQLCLRSAIKDPNDRDKFTKMWKSSLIILYGNDEINQASLLSNLCQRLEVEGCTMALMRGGFDEFKRRYPEWCQNRRSVDQTLLGLENLRISSVTSLEKSNDLQFPIEIIPCLFLGNAEDSNDLESLNKNNIRYILNVTPNLPNAFQQNEIGIKYLQIPVKDDWSQNITPFFSQAIAFIDEARESCQGVLVHCLAGISRSVTITLAYLMHALNISLNEAYDLVKKRKSNIFPNFSFMEQLIDFEHQLNHHGDCKCTPRFSDSPIGTTPDSGIQMDHWDRITT